MATYGYVRVSPSSPSEEEQVEALVRVGVARESILVEEGIDAVDGTGVRPTFQGLMAMLRDGDVIYVLSLDRLVRSTTSLFQAAKKIHRANASLVSLYEPWADTRDGRMAPVIDVLAALADFDLRMGHLRMREGMIRAKNEKSVKVGRKLILTAEQFEHARRMRKEGRTLVEIGKAMGVSHQTIARVIARAESIEEGSDNAS